MKTICPHCNQEYPETPDEYLGTTCECTVCHKDFVIEKVVYCMQCGIDNAKRAPRCRECGKSFGGAPAQEPDSPNPPPPPPPPPQSEESEQKPAPEKTNQQNKPMTFGEVYGCCLPVALCIFALLVWISCYWPRTTFWLSAPFISFLALCLVSFEEEASTKSFGILLFCFVFGWGWWTHTAALENLARQAKQSPPPANQAHQSFGAPNKRNRLYGPLKKGNWPPIVKKTVGSGNAGEAEYEKGNIYKYINLNYTEAVRWYRKAAEQGHADAQIELGLCYDLGNGVQENKAEANRWYQKVVKQCRKAADQGYADAQFSLGECYMYGRGVKEDKKEAIRWYRKAADQGYAKALYELGDCYMYGRHGVVKEDKKEAIRLCRKAADQGYAKAQCQLGDCYNDGIGVRKNKKEAFLWYRKAAEQGHVLAQYIVGQSYMEGWDGIKDTKEGISWLRKAAEQDYVQAQIMLGARYRNGWHVKKNLNEAARWYRKAASQGSSVGEKYLKEIEIELQTNY